MRLPHPAAHWPVAVPPAQQGQGRGHAPATHPWYAQERQPTLATRKPCRPAPPFQGFHPQPPVEEALEVEAPEGEAPEEGQRVPAAEPELPQIPREDAVPVLKQQEGQYWSLSFAASPECLWVPLEVGT